jgi:hypothetical protein
MRRWEKAANFRSKNWAAATNSAAYCVATTFDSAWNFR